jgi:hypothetical protein
MQTDHRTSQDLPAMLGASFALAMSLVFAVWSLG